jgi:hypothetical protein
MYRVPVVAAQTLYGSFWIKIASLPTAGAIMYVYDSGGGLVHTGISVNAAGTIGTLYTGTTVGPNLVSAANICDNVWHHIEFTTTKLQSSAAATLNIYVDGVLVIANGATSVSSTPAGLFAIAFRCVGVATSFDDVIVWDNEGTGLTTSPMGVRAIETLRPSGAGSSAQFTPTGAASNYDCVDEVNRDDDTTYVASSTSGHKDLYAHGNFGTTPTVVSAAIVNTYSRIITGGGLAVIRARSKSGSSEANGASQTITALGYKLQQEAFLVDPATSVAWTGSGVNAAEFGIEVV